MAIELHKNPHNKLLDDNCGIYVSWQCLSKQMFNVQQDKSVQLVTASH